MQFLHTYLYGHLGHPRVHQTCTVCESFSRNFGGSYCISINSPQKPLFEATRYSVTGVGFCLAGGAIAYKIKLQATVATTSSTEAEFVATVNAVKIAKSLCTILKELGYVQQGTTLLYEDNQAVIAIMVNETKPTTSSIVQGCDLLPKSLASCVESSLVVAACNMENV